MEFSNNKEVLTIFDKRGKVVTLATKLAALSGKQVKDFFDTRINKIPRQINRLALIKVLNNKIPSLNSLSLPKDMFFKLQFYNELSEFQLQVLFEKICDDDDFLQYRINLWTLIIRNHDVLNLLDGELQHLSRIKKLPVEDFSNYNKAIFDVVQDINKFFDGIPSKHIEQSFNNTFSSEELRRLAEKYGFDIPARLKKTEFSDFLKQILKSKKKLTVALSKEIDDMTVVQLNSLCQLHEVTLSSNLKKNEIIFLLLFLIKKNKLTTSEIKGISDTWGITPLEFTVDMEKIDTFGRGEAKEVIILPQKEELEESHEESEEPKEKSQEELFKEIAIKLGILPSEKTEEPEEEITKPTPKQKASSKKEESNNISPAERLALARQKRQELELERKLEAERRALEEERKAFEEQKRLFEEQQALEEEKRLFEEQQALEEERKAFEEQKRLFEEQQALNKEIKEKERLQAILNKLLNKQDEEQEESFEDNESSSDEIEVPYEDENVDCSYSEEETEDEIDDLDNLQEEDDEFSIEENSDDIEEEVSELDTNQFDEETSVEPEEVQEEIEETNETECDNLETNEVVSQVPAIVEQDLTDESYDESFNPHENVHVSEVIENPLYKNKKLGSKLRKGLKLFLYVLGAILFFGAGLVASRFLM